MSTAIAKTIPPGTSKAEARRMGINDGDEVITLCRRSLVSEQIPFKSYRKGWQHPKVSDWLDRANNENSEMYRKIAEAISRFAKENPKSSILDLNDCLEIVWDRHLEASYEHIEEKRKYWKTKEAAAKERRKNRALLYSHGYYWHRTVWVEDDPRVGENEYELCSPDGRVISASATLAEIKNK